MSDWEGRFCSAPAAAAVRFLGRPDSSAIVRIFSTSSLQRPGEGLSAEHSGRAPQPDGLAVQNRRRACNQARGGTRLTN